MAATKTAEKAKSSAKSGPKVFDVARPGKSTPSSTARPVIVTNRPILQDPMVSSAADQPEPTLGMKLPGKLTIKPIDGDSDNTETKEPTEKLASAPEVPEIGFGLPAADKPESTADTDGAEDTEETENPDSAESEADAANPEADEPAIAPAAKTDAGTDVAIHADKVGSEAGSAADGPDAQAKDNKGKSADGDTPEGTPAEDGTNADNSKDQKELEALEAKAKQEEEINKLVEAREYFLPINAVERHRSKVIAALGLVLIIILALVLIDIMMDSGMLHIPGVNPVTHFFSASGR